MSEQKILVERDDVSVEVLEWAEEVEEMWYSNEPRVDWDDFWDRFDSPAWTVLNTDSPAARKIVAHVQQMRRDMT